MFLCGLACCVPNLSAGVAGGLEALPDDRVLGAARLLHLLREALAQRREELDDDRIGIIHLLLDVGLRDETRGTNEAPHHRGRAG